MRLLPIIRQGTIGARRENHTWENSLAIAVRYAESSILRTDVTYTCPKDGGNLDVVLDYDFIKSKYKPEDILSRNDPSLWRFLPLLPVQRTRGEFDASACRGGNAGL